MKVHLRQIPAGETLHLEGEEPADALGLEEAGAIPVSPLTYSLDVGVSDGGVFATGRVGVRVRLTCVGCLSEFEHDVEVDPFALQMELSSSELMDLTPAVREDIHLVLPPHPKCDAVGGKPECPAAHVGASSASRQAPERAASAWDALDQIKPTSD